jgi:hypothetical protein
MCLSSSAILLHHIPHMPQGGGPRAESEGENQKGLSQRGRCGVGRVEEARGRSRRMKEGRVGGVEAEGAEGDIQRGPSRRSRSGGGGVGESEGG